MNKYIKQHPAYQYAKDVVDGNTIANEELKIVCKQFLDDLDDPNSKYWFDNKQLDITTKLFGIINMGDGLQQGKPVRDNLVGFQWFFIANTLCWKMANNHEKRKIEKSILLIARKNGKTFLIAIIFILLLLTEPQNSTFFSVAPDLELSSMIKKEIEHILDASPLIKDKFKWTNKHVKCTVTGSTFEPLATSNNRMDGRMAGVFVADEVGALKNDYPISAMTSSQLTVNNPLGVLISTAYPSLHNPMQEEVDAASKAILTNNQNPKQFAMLYKPDEPKKWRFSDNELLKANPLALDVDVIKDKVFDIRREALDMPSKRSNFLTKHMNIFVDGDAGEQFVTETQIESAQLKQEYDWHGQEVYVGFDLSQSGDNTGLSMVTYDSERRTFVTKSWAFYPIQKQEEKKRVEHIDYALMDKRRISFGCGTTVVDYDFIEEFITNIPQKYGVKIKGIGYDRWNAGATVASLRKKGFDMFEVKQNASGLYPGTKLLRESVSDGNFYFEENELLKINFLNATMVTDMNLSYYLNKKKSDGKIDMVAATVNCMALWAKDIEDGIGSITGDLLIL